MKTSLFLAAVTMVSLANPVTAMAHPIHMADVVASYSAAKDYVDTLSGQVFIAAKRASEIAASDETAKAYIGGFSAPAPHSEAPACTPAKIGSGLTQPFTLIR